MWAIGRHRLSAGDALGKGGMDGKWLSEGRGWGWGAGGPGVKGGGAGRHSEVIQ